MRKKLGLFLLIPLILVSNTAMSTAGWYENFSRDLSNWEIYSFYANGTTLQPSSSKPYIDLGQFVFPNITFQEEIAYAWTESTQEYGNWSLDIYLSNDSNSEQFLQVFYISKHSISLNYTDSSLLYSVKVFKAFVVSIFWGMEPWIEGVNKGDLVISIWKFTANPSCTSVTCAIETLATANLGPLNYNGMYSMKITRNGAGNHTVYFDNKYVTSAIDKIIINSENFGLISHAGSHKIDNIVLIPTIVTNTSTPTTTSNASISNTSAPGLLLDITLATGIIMFVFRKKPKS